MENTSPSANRMPRWTKAEILVLIKSKRHVETPGGCYLSSRGRPLSSGTSSLPGASAPPKWMAVSSACADRGVTRGPTQCRKRWGNLSAAFRKIKEYEAYRKSVENEGAVNNEYWGMEMEERRRKGLPGKFDRGVFKAMEGEEEEEDVADEVEGEEDDVEIEDDEAADVAVGVGVGPTLSPIPISMRRFEPLQDGSSDPEMESGKQPDDKSSAQKEGLKRKRPDSFNTEEKEVNSTEKLIQTLERGTRLIAAQLDAYNIQAQLDRDFRRKETDKFLDIFNRIADSVEKIARKFE